MKAAFLILKALTEVFPPDTQARHSVTIQGEKLCLTLHHDSTWHSFLLDDEDMVKPADELVNEIAGLLKKVKDG